MKKVILPLIVLFLIAGAFALSQVVFAHGQQVCFCHDVKHNPHTICTSNQGLIDGHMRHVRIGFDTLGECIAPTATPTPTLTPTPTPGNECDDRDCKPTPTPTVTPTPTEVPTETPTPTPEPVQQSFSQPGPAGAPVCQGVPVTKPPIYSQNLMSRVNKDTVHFVWSLNDPNAQSYGLYYGMSASNLTWFTEVPGHETTQTDIHAIPQGSVWVKICSIGACGDQICGPTLDP